MCGSFSDGRLEFIVSCRTGEDHSDYDMIIGGVANDRVFNTIELYLSNLASKEETIRRLQFAKPNLQVCFRAQWILDRYLSYEGCEQL